MNDIPENKLKQNLFLKTLNDTIKNYGYDFNNFKQTLSEFLNLANTIDVTENHLSAVKEINLKIDSVNVSSEQKIQFKSAFNLLISLICTNDCRGIIISKLKNKNKDLLNMITKLFEQLKKERTSYNVLAKKYNEKQKDETTDFPGFSMSITTKKNNYQIKNV